MRIQIYELKPMYCCSYVLLATFIGNESATSGWIFWLDTFKIFLTLAGFPNVSDPSLKINSKTRKHFH